MEREGGEVVVWRWRKMGSLDLVSSVERFCQISLKGRGQELT
jgi:hypothetical protein